MSTGVIRDVATLADFAMLAISKERVIFDLTPRVKVDSAYSINVRNFVVRMGRSDIIIFNPYSHTEPEHLEVLLTHAIYNDAELLKHWYLIVYNIIYYMGIGYTDPGETMPIYLPELCSKNGGGEEVYMVHPYRPPIFIEPGVWYALHDLKENPTRGSLLAF